LAGGVGWAVFGRGLASFSNLAVLLALLAAATGATSTASATTAATSTAASRRAAALLALFSLRCTALGGCPGRLRLASELDRDLAVEDVLTVQLVDGTLSLGRRGDVNESVPYRAVGAWVCGD